jgi:hypothetical protein
MASVSPSPAAATLTCRLGPDRVTKPIRTCGTQGSPYGNGTITSLPEPSFTGSFGCEANVISNNGQIVANATDTATGQTHALLLTPGRRPLTLRVNPGSTPEWLICALLATPGIRCPATPIRRYARPALSGP